MIYVGMFHLISKMGSTAWTFDFTVYSTLVSVCFNLRVYGMAQSGVSFSLADWTASLRLLLHAKPNPSLHSVPYKLILHFVMLLSLSVVVLCYAFQWGNYSTSMQQITCAYFYPSSCSVEDCSLFLTVNADDCYLYTVCHIGYNNMWRSLDEWYSVSDQQSHCCIPNHHRVSPFMDPYSISNVFVL